MLSAYLQVFLLRLLILFKMAYVRSSYYNVLSSKYGNVVGSVIEHRLFVRVDFLSDWLKTIDLQEYEVLIRDVEELSFDSSFAPRLLQFGD